MKLLSLLLLLGSFAHAQNSESLAIPEEKFAAIVQYANGKQEYDFKDLISFEKTITIPKDSYLKVVTQKRCIAVFYENTKVQTPKDRVSPWEVISGAVRWICPEEKIERVAFKGSELQVQNGEFLLTGNQLAVLRNNVRSENKDLSTQTLYAVKNNKWLPLKNQPEAYDLWNKQEKYPAPTESSRLKAEKPQDPYVTRVFLNGVPLGIAGLYNHEWENHASDYSMETHGVRLGTNFPWKNKSVLVFLEFIDIESSDNMDGMGPPPLGYKFVKSEGFTLGLGLRHSHTKSSSFYYYLGLTHQKMFVHLRPDATDYYDAKIIYPYNATAGGGYHTIFWAKNWISLMIGADARITQSLSQGKVDFFNQPWGENKDPKSMMTQYSAFVYFGPVFNF